jgi:hypothetical protein
VTRTFLADLGIRAIREEILGFQLDLDSVVELRSCARGALPRVDPVSLDAGRASLVRDPLDLDGDLWALVRAEGPPRWWPVEVVRSA